MKRKSVILPQSSWDESSRLSRYFRFLVSFSLIPVKVDYEKKTITFGWTSWRFGIFNSLLMFGLVSQQLSLGLTFGFQNYASAFIETFKNSNATDNISIFGFLLMFSFYQMCLILFYKNLGKQVLFNFTILLHLIVGIISSELTLDNHLKWPKFGWKLVVISFLEFVAMVISGCIMTVKLGITMKIPLISFFLCLAGQVPNVLISCFLLGNMHLFILTWIETFGQTCTKYSCQNIVPHAERCLLSFGALQSGLGKCFRFLSMSNHKFCRNTYIFVIFILSSYNYSYSFHNNIFKHEHSAGSL